MHEVMVPIDDGRMTLELEDRFIIRPAFRWWSDKGRKISGIPVCDGFQYSSDSNDMWLDVDGLNALLEGL